MQKRKKSKKTYHRFWCILWAERLCLYSKKRKDGSTKELKRPSAMLDIADLEYVAIDGGNEGGYFMFILRMKEERGGLSHYFGCREQSQRRSWVSHIQQKIQDVESGQMAHGFNGFEAAEFGSGQRVNGTNSCLLQ